MGIRKIFKVFIIVVVSIVAIWLGFIGHAHINWIKLDPLLNKVVEIYKNGTRAYYGFFFIGILAYIIHAMRHFKKNPEKFTEDIWEFRKYLYVLFLILVGIGVLVGYVEFRDWKMLLQLTAIVIFIDLSVFQTPSITKIWNAEFQQRSNIEKTIESNVEFIDSTDIKLQVFSNVISQTDIYFQPMAAISNNWKDYERELKRYLSLYTNSFYFKVEFFPFQIGNNADEKNRNMEIAFQRLETLFLYKVDDEPGDNDELGLRTQVLQKLSVGLGTTLDPGKLVAIPIFLNHSFLIGVRTSEGSKIDDVDISNIVNLVRIFEWYLQ